MAFTKVAKPTSNFTDTGLNNSIFLLYDDTNFLLYEDDDNSKIIIRFGGGFSNKQNKGQSSFTKVAKT